MTTDTYTVTIDSLSYGGRGVGRRKDGKIVFVPMVLPGETVCVRTDRERPSYCSADLVEVLERSPERIDPECGIFSVCGGCDWQHMSYPAQVYWKDAILKSEIARGEDSGTFQQQSPFPSGRIYGYRGHAILQCGCKPGLRLGFFRKRTNSIVEFDQCPVLGSRVQEIAGGLKAILHEHPVPGISSVEIHAPQEESIILVKGEGLEKKRALSLMERLYKDLGLAGISFAVMNGRRRSDHVIGRRFCRYSLDVGGNTVELSSTFGGFIQANLEVNSALVEHVASLARGARSILDLYSGSGNFSIPLARVAEKVTAVEKSGRLVSSGRISAKKNRVDNVRFLAMDALEAARSIGHDRSDFDTVVLDPPREGAKDVSGYLPAIGPSRIIYVSCNPSTLARDVKLLREAGYALKNIRMFDMFPQTYHIESVAYLER
ncbi:MAG TPA: class I SAM-dependent RNA methyltransferase [Deltaproteobacteria bacterium]|jgi:23S rRNA (uracil1939-C5)-methyltransferase|nr:class I SAM-dependent RNA methyltransferase [Deltaproteobacteria bacterium]